MNVVVYTTPACPYCYQVKEFLSRQGVPFVEKNVAADRQAAMEMVRLSGQQGVPVITVDGQVVVGFDQPRLRQLLQQAHPRLGASVADAASQAAKRPGLPTSGAYVGRVAPGSPAERVGLRPGDVIVALGGRPVTRAADIQQILAQRPRDRDLSLTFWRDGQERNGRVRL